MTYYNPPSNDMGKKSSRKRDNEDFTAKASSALAEMRRIPPQFASPHGKRNKMDATMMNNGGLMGAPVSNQGLSAEHLFFDDRYGAQAIMQPVPASSSSSSSSSRRKLDELNGAILKTNERLSSLENEVHKISGIEKKLDHLIERILRGSTK
jgi:hypothetical protein